MNMVNRVDCRKLRRFLLLSLLLVAGCAKVGPNYARPPAELNQNWLEAQEHRCRDRAQVNTGPGGKYLKIPFWTGSLRPPTGKI